MAIDVEEEGSQELFHQQPEVEHHWLLEGVVVHWLGDLSIDPGVRPTQEEVDHAEDNEVGDEALGTLGDEEPVDMEQHGEKYIGWCDNPGECWAEADEALHEDTPIGKEDSSHDKDDSIVFDSHSVEVVGSPHHQVARDKTIKVKVSG